MRNTPSLLTTLICLLAIFSLSICAHAQVVFEDQFNSSFDFSKWTYVGPPDGNSNGNSTQVTRQTHMALAPFVTSENGTYFARLPLETYDTLVGFNGERYFKGTEIYSRRGFGPNIGRAPGPNDKVASPPIQSSTGFEFETRIRYTNPQPGGVAAFWTYWNHGSSGYVDDPNYSGYEIDHEMFNKLTLRGRVMVGVAKRILSVGIG